MTRFWGQYGCVRGAGRRQLRRVGARAALFEHFGFTAASARRPSVLAQLATRRCTCADDDEHALRHRQLRSRRHAGRYRRRDRRGGQPRAGAHSASRRGRSTRSPSSSAAARAQLMLRVLAQAHLPRHRRWRTLRSEARCWRSFDAHYADTTRHPSAPYAGAHEVLARLQAHGRAPGLRDQQGRCRTRNGCWTGTAWTGTFELVIGGDSLPHQKPHASVLRHVVGALGATRAATAHVGDSRIDVMAARNAGVAPGRCPMATTPASRSPKPDPTRSCPT